MINWKPLSRNLFEVGILRENKLLENAILLCIEIGEFGLCFDSWLTYLEAMKIINVSTNRWNLEQV